MMIYMLKGFGIGVLMIVWIFICHIGFRYLAHDDRSDATVARWKAETQVTYERIYCFKELDEGDEIRMDARAWLLANAPESLNCDFPHAEKPTTPAAEG